MKKMQKNLNKDNSPFYTLGIDPSFNIDEEDLHEKYIEKQKKLHPDNFIEESQKEAASTLSSKLNNAYEIIKNPITRAKKYAEYVIGESIDESSIKTPQKLLFQAMEWQEMIEESSTKEAIEEVHKYAKNLFNKECHIFSQSKENDLIESYIRMKYINRFIENLESKLI